MYTPVYSCKPQFYYIKVACCRDVTCVPNEDSNLHSPIRVFTVRMKTFDILCYPSCNNWRMIVMCECAGWYESLLGAHVWSCIFWHFWRLLVSLESTGWRLIMFQSYDSRSLRSWSFGNGCITETKPPDMCAWRRFRSAYAFPQSDHVSF